MQFCRLGLKLREAGVLHFLFSREAGVWKAVDKSSLPSSTTRNPSFSLVNREDRPLDGDMNEDRLFDPTDDRLYNASEGRSPTPKLLRIF